MKRSTGLVLAVMFGAFVLNGCAMVASPLYGGLITHVKYGDTATMATDSSKEGKACAGSFLNLIAAGDATVAAAKAKGGITEVSTVDHSATSFLGIFAVWCTMVAGK